MSPLKVSGLYLIISACEWPLYLYNEYSKTKHGGETGLLSPSFTVFVNAAFLCTLEFFQRDYV